MCDTIVEVFTYFLNFLIYLFCEAMDDSLLRIRGVRKIILAEIGSNV